MTTYNIVIVTMSLMLCIVLVTIMVSPTPIFFLWWNDGINEERAIMGDLVQIKI